MSAAARVLSGIPRSRAPASAGRPGDLARLVATGGLLGALLALAPADLGVALAVLAVPLVACALLLSVRADAVERRALVPIFLAAVGVRVAVAVAVAYAAPGGYFALDDQRYAALGHELAQHWSGEAPYPSDLHGRTGYYVFNAAIYAVVGFVPLAPTLLNTLLGGLAVVLAYRLARALAGDDAARLAALLTAFCPSLVLWSSLNLKDAAAIVAILVALRGAQRLALGAGPAGLLALAVGLGLLGELRGYLAAVAALALAVALVLPRLAGPRAPLAFVALLAAGAIVLTAIGPIAGLADDASLESLDRARRELAFGASAYHGEADVATLGGALSFLPVGLAYFLFAPAPWQVWNARQVLTLPEMLAWYALLPQVVAGFAFALRARAGAALPLASFALFATVSYALAESNLGTAYRHRAQVLVIFLVFAAIGLARRRERRAAAAAAQASVRAERPGIGARRSA